MLLFIAGASTRAAAQSAVRAGLVPVCADLFGDVDLREIARFLPVKSYPRGLVAASRVASPGPWMYTGALENHPKIIQNISAQRPLWGTPPNAVRRVRDPLRMHRAFIEAGVPAPAVRRDCDPPPPDGRWMLKPRRGAAGAGITLWERAAGESPTLARPHFFQERIAGEPLSAVYLAAPGRTRLIGISRQLVGERWLSARQFAYCGSIGPLRPDERIVAQIEAAGCAAASVGPLRGLFGIDFVGDETSARPVEINPRYTASVEVFELAYGIALLDWHRRACEQFDADDADSPECARVSGEIELLNRRPIDRVVGKAIVYAANDLTVGGSRIPASRLLRAGTARRVVGALLSDDTARLPSGDPSLADIPPPGTRIPAGGPVCTVFAEGRNVDDCLKRLQSYRRYTSVVSE